MYERLEEAYVEQDQGYPVEVSPWHMPPDFLAQMRDAARYGGTEFLDLIIQASETITTRSQGKLPDPIDLNSI
jgi:hypothetical protein